MINFSQQPRTKPVQDGLVQGRHCVPCEGDIAPLTKSDAEETMKHVPGWAIADDPPQSGRAGGMKISRDFVFKEFKEAMVFVNTVADIAENEGHHPDISISWNKVRLELSTHAIGGLSTNDFIVAAKVNALNEKT
ncbi:MAG: 4a-hydroxytetrahydrobiopterin dehydratase [bacterium]|nr:4a-hydroxytetrahydrobiopterin dehydratase [bacterium]